MHLTYEEVGAMLIAIGTQMMQRNLCAGAARDGCSNNEMRQQLIGELHIDEERVECLLEVSNEDLINHY